MSRQNVEIIREFLGAFNRGDYAACLEAIDPDVEWHPPPDIPNAAVAIGRDALVATWRDWLGAWDDYRSIPEEIFEGGADRVLVFAQESGRGKDSGIEVRSRRITGSTSYAMARSCVSRATSIEARRCKPPALRD